MSTYREVWLYVTGVITALGVCVAVLVIPWDILVFTSIVLLMLVAAMTWAWAENRGWRQAIWFGFLTMVATVAAAGYLRLLGVAGAVLLTVLGLTAPPLLRVFARHWLRQRDDQPRSRPGGSRASHGEMSAAASWSAEQTLSRQSWMDGPSQDLESVALCRAWRESYLALGQPVSATCKAGVVQRRRELLDELERRNPAGFTAWLASGAEAAEDPRRYIVTQRGDESHL